MGRGLSQLQRFILSEAAKRKRIYYCEICVEYFGWKLTKKRWGWKQEGFERWGPTRTNSKRVGLGKLEEESTPPDEVGMLKNPGAQFFSRREIGEREYSRVMATLSRSCLRLQQRGLVRCLRGKFSHWAGVEITGEGRQYLSGTAGENFYLY